MGVKRAVSFWCKNLSLRVQVWVEHEKGSQATRRPWAQEGQGVQRDMKCSEIKVRRHQYQGFPDVASHQPCPPVCEKCVSRSVMSDSLRPHGLQPARFLCLWNSPDKSTGVGCHFPLQGIFLTQGWNPGLLWQVDSFSLSHRGSSVLLIFINQKNVLDGFSSATHECFWLRFCCRFGFQVPSLCIVWVTLGYLHLFQLTGLCKFTHTAGNNILSIICTDS